MSAKNYLTLFRALKTDYAYLIALMGFSWLSMYGYPGECQFHDVVATFSFLLILRCRYFHFLMIMLIGFYPLMHYPVINVSGLAADNLFTLMYRNPLKSIEVVTTLPFIQFVPSIILTVLMGVLSILQRIKTPGFNLLRLEFFIIFLTIISVTTLLNIVNADVGWGWEVIDYPPIKQWIEMIKEGIYGTV